MRQETRELLKHAQRARSEVITNEHLLGLPDAVQRYLRTAGAVGQEDIRTVHLRQRGSLRMKEGQRWLPLTAEQYFTTNLPGFVWHARVRLFPLLSISVTDKFVGGHGRLRAKLLSLITLADATGPHVDEGELLRFLAEIIWFPTAWLSHSIEWKTIDAHSAEAILQHAGLKVTATVHLNDDGLPIEITAERYREEGGKFVLRPWRGWVGNYQKADGLLVPMSVEVSWRLESGHFTCFRAEITEIEYNIRCPDELA